MSRFTATGRFGDRDRYAAIDTAADAENEDVARERVLTRLGNRHGSNHTRIEREDVTER